MPAVRSKTLGDRAFMVAARPRLWNSLPKELREITNVNSFKALLRLIFLEPDIGEQFYIQFLFACIYILFIFYFIIFLLFFNSLFFIFKCISFIFFL